MRPLRRAIAVLIFLTNGTLHAQQQKIERVGADQLRGLTNFCVFITKEKQVVPKAVEVFVESLREKAPAELTFVTASPACRTADAIFAYDVGEFYGLVYRLDGDTQTIFIDHTLGVKPDAFIDEFITKWKEANAPAKAP